MWSFTKCWSRYHKRLKVPHSWRWHRIRFDRHRWLILQPFSSCGPIYHKVLYLGYLTFIGVFVSLSFYITLLTLLYSKLINNRSKNHNKLKFKCFKLIITDTNCWRRVLKTFRLLPGSTRSCSVETVWRHSVLGRTGDTLSGYCTFTSRSQTLISIITQ